MRPCRAASRTWSAGATLGGIPAASRRDYPITRDEAERAGSPWDGDEDAVILVHLDEPARDVALALGRTLWAVRHRRMRLRRNATRAGSVPSGG